MQSEKEAAAASQRKYELLQSEKTDDSQINQYGYTLERWEQLSPREKKNARARLHGKGERRREQRRRYRLTHREQKNALGRTHYRLHREEICRKAREKRQIDPEMSRLKAREYARKQVAAWTPEEWAAKRAADRLRWANRTPEQIERRREFERLRRSRDASKRNLRVSPAEVFAQISKAVPFGLPRHQRDDLIGSMCLAVLEGKLLIKNIRAEVAKFVAAYNREYDGFKTLSLDAELPGTKKRYIDGVAADQEQF